MFVPRVGSGATARRHITVGGRQKLFSGPKFAAPNSDLQRLLGAGGLFVSCCHLDAKSFFCATAIFQSHLAVQKTPLSGSFCSCV